MKYSLIKSTGWLDQPRVEKHITPLWNPETNGDGRAIIHIRYSNEPNLEMNVIYWSETALFEHRWSKMNVEPTFGYCKYKQNKWIILGSTLWISQKHICGVFVSYHSSRWSIHSNFLLGAQGMPLCNWDPWVLILCGCLGAQMGGSARTFQSGLSRKNPKGWSTDIL